MKYNEAIDMILDGGMAKCKGWENKSFYILFGSSGGLIDNIGVQFYLHKEDVTRTDWIVEKDGVVYEEYHPFVSKKDWFKTFSEDVSCPLCHSKDLIKFRLKDVRPDWYTCTKCQWQGIFVDQHPIIADEVNEEWLEKKVRCIFRRTGLIKEDRYVERRGTCCNADCQFCFPEGHYARIPSQPAGERAMNPTAIDYLQDLEALKEKVAQLKIDAIVALKRSGWIAGVYLSNKLTIPVFTPSEIKSIPIEFLVILVLDDKVWSGKSMRKVLNKLKHKNTLTASLYLEEGYRKATDIWVREIPRKGCRMWYEL